MQPSTDAAGLQAVHETLLTAHSVLHVQAEGVRVLRPLATGWDHTTHHQSYPFTPSVCSRRDVVPDRSAYELVAICSCATPPLQRCIEC